jgi:uncharacterized protein (TIGR03790 family)
MPKPGSPTRACPALLFVLAALAAAVPARALEPDELLLVVNANAPEGRDLAAAYAKIRGVPDGRVVELDLPFPAEQMPRAAYDSNVVPRVREFINANGLRDKVKCAVTLYGVPLRVEGRSNTPEDDKEAAALDADSERVRAELVTGVEALEKFATANNPAFKPQVVEGGEEGERRRRRDPLESPHAATVQALSRRADAAMLGVLGGAAGNIADEAARKTLGVELRKLIEPLIGGLETVLKLADPNVSQALGGPVTPEDVEQSKAKLADVQRRLAEGARAPDATPATKRELTRKLVRENLGAFKHLALLVQQRQALQTQQSEAAFDSELALLWWDEYPLTFWQLNPLHHRMRKLKTPPVMMVTRLDAHSPEIVRRMIETSVKVEREGLSGNVLLDARGKLPPDAYGRYDQTIRDLGEIVKSRTQLPLTLDDQEPVFAADTQKDVALYCGWYSLRNYVPAFAFKPGAVGFHIASSELVSLRGENERGWVRNLLNDGVVATVGPVAEPYLHSFPAADEFFPLLMTGELTLAEAYWRSNPLTSWMNTCVGDPLYAPFKARPALKREDLPERLRAPVTAP